MNREIGLFGASANWITMTSFWTCVARSSREEQAGHDTERRRRNERIVEFFVCSFLIGSGCRLHHANVVKLEGIFGWLATCATELACYLELTRR